VASVGVAVGVVVGFGVAVGVVVFVWASVGVVVFVVVGVGIAVMVGIVVGRNEMTRDQIIALAREAGLERIVDVHEDGTRTVETMRPDLLERFAALVAAAERERCAKIVEQYTGAWNDEGFALAAKIRKGE